MLINSIGQNFACCWQNLYWTRRMFFHFPSRQNIGACIFEVGNDKTDLDYLCLKTPFFVFPSQVECSHGSHPHSAWTPCVFWCTALITLVRRERAGFSHWVGGEQSLRDKREISPRLQCCFMQWHPGPAPPRSHEVSQDSFRTSLWAFFIQKRWPLCSSKL